MPNHRTRPGLRISLTGRSRQPAIRLLLFGLLGIVHATIASADDHADRTATYLAGLAVPALSPQASTPPNDPWISHASELSSAWKHTETAQLAAIANWAPDALGSAYAESGTMFYMFSGPD